MGRNGNGVKAASATSIEITFMFRGVRCRERVPLKPTASNLRRAEQHRAAVVLAISSGTFDYAATFPNSPRAQEFAPPPSDKLETYLETWLADKKRQLKTSTYHGYKKITENQLIPWFGSIRITEFKRKDIRDKLKEHEASNKTLANIQSVLRSALDDALDDDLIQDNPLSGWTYSKEELPKENTIDPLSKDEQAAILKHIDGQGRNLIRFALWTGLRTSELVALNWTDIDFIRGVAMITKAQTQKAQTPESTKTVSGRREVKLLPEALAALADQKAHTFMAGKEIFQNPQTLERWTGDQPIRKTLWTYCLKRAGVRYRNPYQTRHTYASMMLSSGEHPMWVASQMGHKDWTMIARVYGKWMPDAAPDAGSKAVEKFGKNDSISPALEENPNKYAG